MYDKEPVKRVRGPRLAGVLLLLTTSLAGCARHTWREDRQPWPVPGLIEAENFDEGTWWDPAYHDTTWRNEAPAEQRYRNSSVDIGVDPKLHLVDVGWVRPGEWLEYTVDVKRRGLYHLVARIATPLQGKIFEVWFRGVNKTGPVAVPNTGCWGSDLEGHHCFGEATAAHIALDPGVQRMRLMTGTGDYTIDWLRLDLEE